MFNLSIPEQAKPVIYYSKLNLPAKIMAGKVLNSGEHASKLSCDN
jgi:hypothetical protein